MARSRLVALACSFAIAALLLSGCSDGTKTSAASTSTSNSRSLSHAATSAAVVNRTNHAPTASITLAGNGTAAANATFVLAGNDTDNDTLHWTLSFGDNHTANGTVLPTNVTHEFVAGDYVLNFTVSDGKLNATQRLNFTLAEVSAPAVPISFTGHVYGPDPTVNEEGECLFAITDQDGIPPGGGISGDYFAIEGKVDAWSYAFDVDGMVAQFTKAGSYDGNQGSSGTVPEGADGVLVCSTTAVNTDYTLTLTPA